MATTRGEAGAASIIVPACASRLTGSWFSERGRFPPQNQRSPDGKRLSYPPVSDPAVPPIRPELHVPNSFATLRLKLAQPLTRTLKRCHSCQQRFMTCLRLEEPHFGN